jgi:hypothetical protein
MILAVSGKARSGKGEFAKIAEQKYGAQIINFAGALKEEVIDFLQKQNIPFRLENIYGENKYREETFAIIKNNMLLDHDFPINDLTNRFGKTLLASNYLQTFISYRSLLQWWGTEYRRSQDNNYWVKRALAKCKPWTVEFGKDEIIKENLYIIDDLRFENEAIALIDAGAKLIRVERPNNPNPISNPWHESECSLDEWIEWDYIIENASTLEEYHSSVRMVLEEILNGNN